MRRGTGSLKRTFIGIAIVNQAGNWLTFLALIVIAQKSAGAAGSSAVFLAQTLPALIAARAVSDRIPTHHIRRVWVGGQLLLAVLTLMMYWGHHSVAAILAYAAVSMLARSILAPLFVTLLVESVAAAHRPATLTGVGAAGSLSLMLAPALGSTVLSLVGAGALFLLDAVSFLVIGLWVASVREMAVPAATGRERGSLRASLPGPRDLRYAPGLPDQSLWQVPVLAGWLALLLAGALLNGVETPYSFTVLGMTDAGFGLALACFGAGGVTVLVISAIADRTPPHLLGAALVYAAGILVWLAVPRIGAYLGFGLAGAGAALISGQIRTGMDAWARAHRVDPALLWGWANQTTLLINLLGYGATALAFALGVSAIAVAAFLVLALAALVLAAARCPREPG